jgi:hypothetical protein
MTGEWPAEPARDPKDGNELFGRKWWRQDVTCPEDTDRASEAPTLFPTAFADEQVLLCRLPFGV